MTFKQRYEGHRYEHATVALTGQKIRTGTRHTRWTSFVLAADFRLLALGAIIVGAAVGWWL